MAELSEVFDPRLVPLEPPEPPESPEPQVRPWQHPKPDLKVIAPAVEIHLALGERLDPETGEILEGKQPVQIPMSVVDEIDSWRRVLHDAKNDNKVRLFERAAKELMRLRAEQTDQIAQDIVDKLQAIADASEIDAVVAQEIMARAVPSAEEAEIEAALENPVEEFPTDKKADLAIVPISEWINGFGAASDPLIDDVNGGEIIGKAQQGILYGPAGTGKTAVVNEFVIACATGAGVGNVPLSSEPIYRSMKGRVLIAVYEDPIDYRRRILALALDRQIDLATLDVGFVPPGLDITKDRDRTTFLEMVRTDAKKNGTPALLIIDTTAAAVGGKSLNDDDVVGSLFALSGMMVREFFCTVIFVAHPGKDETRGIAGSYRLYGNSDFVLKTLATKNGFRLMKDKDRNGAPRAIFDYSLKYVEVEQTTSGKPRTGAIVASIVPCPQESHPQHVGPEAKPSVKGATKVALDVLQKAIDEAGTIPPVSNHIPQNTRTIFGRDVANLRVPRNDHRK